VKKQPADAKKAAANDKDEAIVFPVANGDRAKGHRQILTFEICRRRKVFGIHTPRKVTTVNR
jgi:hypothetical protein